jgi:hypothetical protein
MIPLHEAGHKGNLVQQTFDQIQVSLREFRPTSGNCDENVPATGAFGGQLTHCDARVSDMCENRLDAIIDLGSQVSQESRAEVEFGILLRITGPAMPVTIDECHDGPPFRESIEDLMGNLLIERAMGGNDCIARIHRTDSFDH